MAKMKRRWVLGVLGGAAGAVVADAASAWAGSTWAGASVGNEGAGTANAALHWSGVAETVIGGSRSAGSAGVLGGIVHMAMHDAAAAVTGRHRGLLASRRVRGPASVSAAVATAGYLVLVARVPEQAGALAEEYAAYLARVRAGETKRRGVDAGRVIAEAVIAGRVGDGLDTVVPWVQPPTGPGTFEPVLANPDGTPVMPVGVELSRVRPLLMHRLDQFRPAGPDRLASSRYAAHLAEVQRYGRVDSPARDTAQTDAARFWAENTFVQWSRTLRQLAAARRLDTAAAARMLGLAHAAAADAVVGCFDAKYHHLFWRPVHAIARADLDGNPATTPEPTWRALLTVNHPEYPSAHACWSFAVTATLAAFFGTDNVPLTIDSTITGTSRTYWRLSEPAREILGARVWAGLHLRNSTSDGARLGRQVAHLVTARAGLRCAP
jgi:hypothetical protein